MRNQLGNFKKVITLSIIVYITLSYLSCKEAMVLERPKFNLKAITTEEEARTIASKHGYNDIDMTKYDALLYMTKVDIEKYFQEQSYYRSVGNEYIEFKKEVKNITSIEDYIDLTDKYPNYRQSVVKGYKGEVNYQNWIKEMCAEPYHIYINDSSVVYFCPARLDNIKRGEVTNWGKRVDTLKD